MQDLETFSTHMPEMKTLSITNIGALQKHSPRDQAK